MPEENDYFRLPERWSEGEEATDSEKVVLDGSGEDPLSAVDH